MAEMQTSHSHHNFKSHRNRFLMILTYILQTMFYAAPLGLLGCRPAGAIGMPPRWGCTPSGAEVCPFLDYAQNSGRGETLYLFLFHSSISFAILHVNFYVFLAPALGEPSVEGNEELTPHASHAALAQKNM